MSLSGIIHHSHSFTRLKIYHHIYLIIFFIVINQVFVLYILRLLLLEAMDSWAMNIDRRFVNVVGFLDMKKIEITILWNTRFLSHLSNRTQTSLPQN